MTTRPPRMDGRTARSERTRNAIVDAHVSLITAGDLRPTADRIAKLAGVSLRALWSHFADMEALFTASAQRILDMRDKAFVPISPDLPLTERIDTYLEGLRDSRAVADEQKDTDSVDLLTGIITEFEKHGWFLRASLET